MKILLLILSLIGFSHVGHTKNITVGVESLEYMPFYSGKGRAGYSGFARNLFDAFAKDTGHTITYIPMDVTKLFNKYLQGEVMFKFPDNPLWQKDSRNGRNISYSEVIISTKVGVLSLSANAAKDIKTIGVVEGFTPWSVKSDIDSGKLKSVSKKKMLTLIKLLKAGKIDAIYGSIDVAKFHGGSDLAFHSSYKPVTDEFYLSTIKENEIIQQFNSWAKGKKEFIDELKKKEGF